MDILYYSNYCKHSKKLISTLTKNNMNDKISFICIDKRSLDKNSNQTYLLLENGSKITDSVIPNFSILDNILSLSLPLPISTNLIPRELKFDL